MTVEEFDRQLDLIPAGPLRDDIIIMLYGHATQAPAAERAQQLSVIAKQQRAFVEAHMRAEERDLCWDSCIDDAESRSREVAEGKKAHFRELQWQKELLKRMAEATPASATAQ